MTTTLQELTERVSAAVGEDSGLGKSFKVDLRGEGIIHIDGAQVSNDDKPADLTVSISQRDLKALGTGELNPMTAVITGRLKVSDMGLAMSLQPQMQALFSKLS
ncbi:MAG: SCP2 sterol-binding domain-containing protein [Pseudomonadota bacterium]|uniref:SCP2 sterol-binding domain-containing protein n=1 Tax=Phenylobacterium sp. TaxID=1871053 RepID=UPI0025F306AC|nr:SCP2 sterol-binding domain-containing protein [Phenylobacterium sp.]MBT9473421.1 SCP2 sterol-binding domain-containing protein [Phenylobacterium sp.]